jgi:hypothetical protein
MLKLEPEKIKAGVAGIITSLILAGLIAIGSRNLSHFDAALVGYTFATLFAAFGITYRHVMWMQRPPTAMYWKRGWQAFFHPSNVLRNSSELVHKILFTFVLNRFIWRRKKERWAAHWMIMWGCVLAVAITFPLVFGWIHFETLPDDLEWYRVFVFGFPTFAFPVHSWPAFFIFHGLVWASILVTAGVMIAMRRRMLDHGAAALQQFGEDFLPLILLFAISITGLMLTASYTWMKGYGYDFLAILHAITVIFTLLWLPFGKFFHIFQRPAQLGVSYYKERGREGEQARCLRCNQPFASAMHVADLTTVQRQLDFKYELNNGAHYQQVCPKCRRSLLAIAQGKLWQAAPSKHEN